MIIIATPDEANTGSGTRDLLSNTGGLSAVVGGGYCVGCGACAALDNAITMARDEAGRRLAVLPADRAPTVTAEATCPFADGVADENEIAAERFSSPEHAHDSRIGRSLGNFAGWVDEGNYRADGSSGGMGAWLLCELLERGFVDSVVHVVERPRTPGTDEPLFAFAVSSDADTVRAHAKSRYYPVEMSGVIAHMIATPGRYAVVAVPCFAKALRLAARQSPILSERLAFIVGIVCGHLKSEGFGEALAWQCGVSPEGLTAIDFRVKLAGRPANRYGLHVEGMADGAPVRVTRPMEGLVGANWGHGLFKLKACEFCDDVLAETADVVVGDAWLPTYEGDHRGTNVVVVREPRLLALMREAAEAGRLRLDEVTTETVVKSQAAGLRHRRDGLAYRLWWTDKADEWRPTKRVAPSWRHLTPKLRRIHRLRYALGQASHTAFLEAKRADDFIAFQRAMTPLIRRYDREQSRALWRRVAGKVKTFLWPNN